MTTIEIMSTSIATRSETRDLVTATTTLIATKGLDKESVNSSESSLRPCFLPPPKSSPRGVGV